MVVVASFGSAQPHLLQVAMSVLVMSRRPRGVLNLRRDATEAVEVAETRY